MRPEQGLGAERLLFPVIPDGGESESAAEPGSAVGDERSTHHDLRPTRVALDVERVHELADHGQAAAAELRSPLLAPVAVVAHAQLELRLAAPSFDLHELPTG